MSRVPSRDERKLWKLLGRSLGAADASKREMRPLLLIAMVALSACAVRAGHTRDPLLGREEGTVPLVGPGSNIPVVIQIDSSGGSLCGPDDADPQHTCPKQAGPER
jgi:hypothetical protein